jgi:negative regulator of sigma E activity
VKRRTRRCAVAFAAVTAIVAGGAMPTPTAATTGSPTSARAAALVEQTRTASRAHDLTGSVVLTWRDVDGRRQHALVSVRSRGGTVELDGAARDVITRGDQTYVSGAHGWSDTEGDVDRALPSPGRHWSLSVVAGPLVAGRPTHVVVARRPGDGAPGRVAQRLFVDDASGWLLRREVLDEHGRVERSSSFHRVDIEETAGAPLVAPRAHRTAVASRVRDLRRGFRAPESLGTYTLVGGVRRDDGTMQLTYHDGLFSVSVFERRGALEWDDLPDGGVKDELADRRVERYAEPGEDVLVWEDGGVVFTCASDAPEDALAPVVEALAPDDHGGVVDDAVDLVLTPFGWS